MGARLRTFDNFNEDLVINDIAELRAQKSYVCFKSIFDFGAFFVIRAAR